MRSATPRRPPALLIGGALWLAAAGCPAPTPSPEPAKDPVPTATAGPSRADLAIAPPDSLPPLDPSAPSQTGPFEFGGTEHHCRYRLQDLYTERLGETLFAGHTLNAEIEVDVVAQEGHLAFRARLLHGDAKGQREDYRYRLDSHERSAQIRLRGGSDLLIAFEAVHVLNFVDLPLVWRADPRLHPTAAPDTKAFHDRLWERYPPRPRAKAPDQKRLRDATNAKALLSLLYPVAVLVPAKGPLKHGARFEENVRLEGAATEARGTAVTEMRHEGGSLWIKQSRRYSPTPDTFSSGGVMRTLLAAQGHATVQMVPGDPCFHKAAYAQKLKHKWSGFIEGQPTETLETISWTRVWTKAPTPEAAPPTP